MNNTTKQVLHEVLTSILKMLHPFMPYVTEEIYSMLPIKEEESIMISQWPEFKEEWNFAKEESDIETIKGAVRGIRNVRSEMNVPPSKKAKVFVDMEDFWEQILQICEVLDEK